jgi:hypothetical protein
MFMFGSSNFTTAIGCCLFPAVSYFSARSSYSIKPGSRIFLLFPRLRAPRMAFAFRKPFGSLRIGRKCPGITSTVMCNEFPADGF